MKRVAVIGAGWAGLAAAVHACRRGHRVTLVEMAHQAGGRARSVTQGELTFDNGQHILIGAYTQTLELMRTVGVEPDAVLARMPLALALPDGGGLKLPPGPPAIAFARGVLGHRGWRLADRLALLRHAIGWRLAGFRCEPDRTVAELTAKLPAAVRAELIDPLSVAALNTPSDQASAAVLLRVLRDGLFGGPGCADLLLPRRPLGALLPEPALRWLAAQAATLRLGERVRRIAPAGAGWAVDGQPHDVVVLATSAAEAARLVEPIDAAWAHTTQAMPYEPIVTVLLECAGARLAAPMVTLRSGPAQFAFDHGAIGGTPGRFAFVISGATAWLAPGRDAAQGAVLEQAGTQFPRGQWPAELRPVSTTIERRATFRCLPALARPPAQIAPGLLAAGDYVQGPYPATLEGAVRAGVEAARHCD